MERRNQITIVTAVLALTAAIFIFLYLSVTGKTGLMTYAQSMELQRQALVASGDAGGYFEAVEDVDELEFAVPMADGIGKDNIKAYMNYVTDTLYIDIMGADDTYISEHPLSGASTHIDNLLCVMTGDRVGYEITFDSAYDFETSVKDGMFYVSLAEPHELYDYVVVIDPGHGGTDSPGTVWNGVNESALTLQISEKIMEYKDELADMGIGLYTTRTQDVYTYLSGRADMANDMNADLFLSIHCNALTYSSNDTYGVETLYSQSDTTGRSKALAKLCSSRVSATTGARNRGVVKGDEVYIVRSADVPVALCEVGFMSCANELSLLETESYQEKIAEGFYDVIVQTFRKGFKIIDASGDASENSKEATNTIVDLENDE